MMSRLTAGNVFKALLALLFCAFVAFFVLLIGIGAKNKKVITEGAGYAAIFVLAIALSGPKDSALSDLSALAGLGSMAVAAVRCFMLRDLWLPRKNRQLQPQVMFQQQAPGQASYQAYIPVPGPAPTPAPALLQGPSARDLSPDLAWTASRAKQNKHRLPSDAYVTILETCQTLDAVIDAETQQPSKDARFEYELAAIVREYLPAVLKGYLAIPPAMVDDRQPNGKTPNEELNEQLHLLSRQADTLHSSRHRQTSAELSSTGNFLRERFGHHQKGEFDFGID